MKFDYMVGAVIHDLKNQLQTLQVCELDAMQQIPAQYHHLLKPIVQNTNRLQNDAMQMMTLFRLEKAVDFPLDDAWPHDTVLDAIESMQIQFPNIKFVNDIAETIQSVYNDDLLQLALTILITNSAQAGATRIKISAEETSGDNGKALLLHIADNGHGFDQSVLNGEKITTKTGGSGLGLYLVDLIAEHHSLDQNPGTVNCNNLPKGGAEVCIHIPQA